MPIADFRPRDTFSPPVVGLSAVTLPSLLPFLNVKDYGAKIDGVTDDTAAWQAAVTALSAGGTLLAPPGISLITDTITIANHRVRIIGAGKQASIIKFQPTAGPKAVFLFDHGMAGALAQNALIGFGFYSTDVTFQKIAVKVVDTEETEISNIQTLATQWTGATSIGIQTMGRQMANIHDVELWADKPIDIQQNPRLPGIDADHYHLWNLYLVANTNPNISVATSVVLSNTTFDGYQAWVQGTNGFVWAGTNVASSANVSFKNIRWEQQQGGAGYFFDVSGTTGVVGFRIENAQGGLGAKGIRLRTVNRPTIQDYTYLGTSVAFDIDSSVASCAWINSSAGSIGASVSVTGQDPVFATNIPADNNSPLRSTVFYCQSSNAVKSILVYGTKMWSAAGTLTSGAALSLPVTGAERSLTINLSVRTSAAAPEGATVLATMGAGGTAVFLNNTTNVALGNTPVKFCVFWQSTTTMELLNNLATSAEYVVTMFWN